jgi:hypothetical protein
MSEAKQRRAVFSELKELKASELAATVCAWKGCEAAYERNSDAQPPDGWRIFYLMKRYDGAVLPNGEPVMRIFSSRSGLERDAVLCPQHAKQLDEELLKPLNREVLAEAAGNA